MSEHALTPEEKARQNIDRMFEEAGWKVVDRKQYTPDLAAVAIREGYLMGHLEADYLLFINGKAVGVLEAKREEIEVSALVVTDQAETYTRKMPKWYQVWANPLPLVYVSNGKKFLYRDLRNPDEDYKPIKRVHTPKEITKLLGITDFYAGLPNLQKRELRDCQYEAIIELEKSFRSGKNRALMVLATGAGKTYTACLASYRFLTYTKMRRVLFLVDRNNLGKQAETEFGTFRLTDNGDAFNTIYTVNRIRSSQIPNDSNVVISTIQRLFSLLKGDNIEDTDEDDELQNQGEIELPTNPNLPHDFFDLIIIDECHRSIYGNWRKVLEYFSSAHMIGLTATPVPETESFFNKNRIINYTLEQSIVDGVNVDYRVYRIKTKATENGGAILEGDKLKVETRYTGEVQQISNKETKNYTKEELNRSIVNPSQIELILSTYRDAVYSELYPEREPNMDYIPKTLIFALNDAHASNIVQIGKEVFGRTDDRFIQKITYSSGDSNELIRQFRNDKDFRIAVTCTLVATGTDVKPLEVVMFMRDVRSLPLYTQMKGRGVRTIGDEQLRNVTPNATSKDDFFLIDAVGVTEHDHVIPGPTDTTKEVISLEILLERIKHGYLPDDYLKRLASVLARLHNKANLTDRAEFKRRSGEDMRDLATRIYRFLENEHRPAFHDINDPNTERKELVAKIANNPEVGDYILILAAGFVNTMMPGEDELISKGFSVEEAQNTTKAFEVYIEAHRDDIEALRILYNNTAKPITYAMLKDLENRLKLENNRFSPRHLWNSYTIVCPSAVRQATKKDEIKAITNIIQLVRFAYHQIERLESLCITARQYFNLWCGQNQRELTSVQKEIIEQVVDYIAINGACFINDFQVDDIDKASKLVAAFGGMEQADAALESLFNFIVLRKTA